MKSWLQGPRAFALAGALAMLFAGALVAASLAGRSDGQAAPEPPAALDSSRTSQLLAGIPQDGTALGRPDAPVAKALRR